MSLLPLFHHYKVGYTNPGTLQHVSACLPSGQVTTEIAFERAESAELKSYNLVRHAQQLEIHFFSNSLGEHPNCLHINVFAQGTKFLLTIFSPHILQISSRVHSHCATG